MEKARWVQVRMNEQLPHSEHTNLQFANGWLSRSKHRNGFKVYPSHGESGDAYERAIIDELPMLHDLLSAFQPKDAFNADEFGLFYRQAPTTTVGPRRLTGKKKDRITLLASTNADGSEHVASLVI